MSSAIGEAALSAFFDSLLRKLRSPDVLELATQKQACLNQLNKWEEMLQNIQPLLNDAEVKQWWDGHVMQWLRRLQQLAYYMDDILEVLVAKSLELKEIRKKSRFLSSSFTYFSSPVSKFNIEMMSKIREVSLELEILAKDRRTSGLSKIDCIESLWSKRLIEERLSSISSMDEAMERDRDAIVELLLSNNVDDGNGVAVIPIVGTCGIGKTTLAQLVYNDDRVKNHFDIKAWVHISDEFDDDVTRITKTILHEIGCCEFDDDATDLGMLQVKLKERLTRNKLLVVLDDVWIESYAIWMILRSPFDVGAPGSKILLTTGSQDVSNIMRTVPAYQLNPLPEDSSFSLLIKYALGSTDNLHGSLHFRLEEIALKIAQKLRGLPLEAKIIGSLMRSNLEEKAWEDILRSEIWDLPARAIPVFPAFLVSYNLLPPQLKLCFAYCSIFPMDYGFKEEIVFLWMAEGFLSEAENRKEMENLGRRYFQELVARSFFQRSSMNESRFVMHGLIYDLAQFVAGTISSRVRPGSMIMEISEQICHLSYYGASSVKVSNFKASKRLRTFISFAPPPPPQNIHQCISNDVLHNSLPKLKFLRVLSLREFSESKLPDFIGDLRHLRYLDLSHSKIRSLPEALCALYNLQTLLLRQCRNLEKLPSKTGKLINLRHLDISEMFSLTGMPYQIGELTNLQTLPCFVLARGAGYHIRAMENLQNLKGQLSISGLENIVTTADASVANLGDKLGLRRLKLKWNEHFGHDTLSRGVVTEVLHMLQPTKMLEELTIKGYDGTLFPNWVGDRSFSSLKSLELKNCKKCRSMPSIGSLPLLRNLCIKGMHSLRSVGVEFLAQNYPNVSSPLETLLFEDMPDWRGWNFDEQSVNLPCLRELSIISCPKLLGRLPSQLPSLEKLLIRGCNQLVVSISSLPLLHQLEIDGCKKLVHESSVELNSLKSVSLSNVSELTCLTERLILGLTKVMSLKIDGCEEMTSLWQNKWGLLGCNGSLKDLMISNCPKLVPFDAEDDEEGKQQLGIPPSFNHLNLSLISCKLPKVSRIFTCLRVLTIENCPKLVSFSEKSFPVTIKRLVIRYCENLQYLLDKGDYNFINLCFLEDLIIEWCPSLISLSSGCELHIRLQNLHIAYCSKLESLSSNANLPVGLKRLHISTCQELKSIGRELPIRLQSLQIWGCSKLKALSQSNNLPQGLKWLQISDCEGLRSLVQTVHDSTSLEYIGVIGCKNIESLPQGLEKLQLLHKIELVYCPSLISFPGSRLPTTLTELKMDDCERLQSFPNNFHNLTSLKELEISHCCFPKEGFPANLKSLSISRPKTQKTLQEWELHRLTSLEQLTIEGGCPNVVSFAPKELETLLPTSLVQLTIKDFPSLKSLSSKGFQKLTSLKFLSIMECPKLMSLPKKDALCKLSRLHIDDCPLLKTRCLNNSQERYKIARIPYVRIDDRMLHEED